MPGESTCVNNLMMFFLDLLQCTNEANVSIPEMANLLIERTQNANWVVVFKALITVHNLMNYGNEVNHNVCRYDQEVAEAYHD